MRYWSIFFAVLRYWEPPNVPLSMVFVVEFLSVVISILSYAMIFLKLRNNRTHVLNNHPHRQQSNEGGIPLNIARYKKTVSSIARVQLALVICYLPFIICFFVTSNMKVWRDGARITWYFSATLVYLNSSLNPILSCWKIKEVRQVVKDTVKQFFLFIELSLRK